MKRLSILICAVVMALVSADVALAQFIPPGGSQFNPPPPLPPPLPPPQVGAYVTPMVDAPPGPNYRPARRPSFSDRITTCLHEAAAAGLGPSERAAYSRSCANQ